VISFCGKNNIGFFAKSQIADSMSKGGRGEDSRARRNIKLLEEK
jgi:hypothetical protein